MANASSGVCGGLWRWGILLVSPMATIGIGSLLVCPLFVVYAMMRSDAGFWRRTTTIICETVLWVLHVLVVALYLL